MSFNSDLDDVNDFNPLGEKVELGVIGEIAFLISLTLVWIFFVWFGFLELRVRNDCILVLLLLS